MGTKDTNINLLERIQNPTDRGAWEEFYDFYWEVITGWAKQMGCNETQAEDVFQETILSLIKNSEEIKYTPEKGSFRALLKTIVRRRVVDGYRKNARYVETAPQGGDIPEDFDYLIKESSGVEEPVYEMENTLSDIIWLKGILSHAIKITAKKVDPLTYKSFCLHVLDAYPVDKVAKELGIGKTKTIYQQKRRFMEILKREFINLLKKFRETAINKSNVRYEAIFTKAIEETLHGKKDFRATQIVNIPSPTLFKRLHFIDNILKNIPDNLEAKPVILLISLKKDISPPYINKFFTFVPERDFTSQWIELKDRTVIGRRENCDIVLSYQGVSGIHATIEKNSDGKYLITDQQSTNGVFVNSKKISKSSILIDGDIIQISKMYIIIFLEGKIK